MSISQHEWEARFPLPVDCSRRYGPSELATARTIAADPRTGRFEITLPRQPPPQAVSSWLDAPTRDPVSEITTSRNIRVVARALRAYVDEMVEAGFSREDSIELAAGYQSRLLESLSGQSAPHYET